MAPLYDQFLLFGDSITEFAECHDGGYGFAAGLRDSYIRRLEVVNRGLSGYNTDMALRVISKAIPRPDEGRIRLMTVFFGANDSCFPTESNNQCVPLPEFRSNLIKIIRNPVVAAHNPRIILITNPPVDERKQYILDTAKGYPLRRTAENTMKYAEAIRNVGKSLNVPVVDIWTEIMLKAGWTPGQTEGLPGCRDVPPSDVLEEYLFDGLHLAPVGYHLLYDKILECIANTWPDQLPENLPYVLPRWDDGDAWRLRGETDPRVIYHRPRAYVDPFTGAKVAGNGTQVAGNGTR
ncbi:hypothetical protein, variant 1 [Verruconis gallopava]|uniref:SGNH hydrolase-type esterase domain-containing protein n=1 Tax=Verruconis gallopava TaxID=253628 RepID=A0A0D1XEN3_9PEZI|nr:hypothetical protein, variant 1 [Verruconis gallopava]KIW00651.1 hypothetical protein, variant 1 [Verruconis gallopava]